MNRGTYGFEVDSTGRLIDNAANFERLQRLFRDGRIIEDEWGPGNRGDFDQGSWHILCHLAGGSGVLETGIGRAWCSITHVAANDSYQATLTYRRDRRAVIVPLSSPEGKALTEGAKSLAFVEGSSKGHILARGVRDADNAFNGWPRQMFDKSASASGDGGTVWEHWCTTRDIRPSNAFGSSVLSAWQALVGQLGGRFVAAVARGRREHKHPRQLVALVKAGVLTAEEATWDTTPEPIPADAEALLYEARPADSLAAAESLGLDSTTPRYMMFERRIDKWSRSDEVQRDLREVP